MFAKYFTPNERSFYPISYYWSFSTFPKNIENRTVLTFSGGTEEEQWHKMVNLISKPIRPQTIVKYF